VVDSTGSSGRKVEYQGKEYDYVFDVDIEEGKPPLKLPYNLTDNPYEAATKFLGDNELPISYIDQVAQFIVSNTKGATIGQSTEASSADPYGTESRYQPDQMEQWKKYLPHKEYLALTQAKWEPVAKKLKSLNEKHVLAGNKHIALNPDGVKRLETVLQAAMGTPIQKTSPPALLESQRNIYTLVTQWPYGDRLPTLDVLRCFVAWPGSASLSDSNYGNVVDIILRGALDSQDPVTFDDTPLSEFIKTADASKLNVNNVMMAIRAVTNLFATPEGRSLATSEATAILTLLGRIAGVADDQADPIGAANNNLQIALSSATFNYACLAFNEKDSLDGEHLMQLYPIAEAVIQHQTDPEVLFRALMTLGMLAAAGGDAREVTEALGLRELAAAAAKKSDDARIRAVAQECSAYLKK
jgi:phospholipase A-2-activating protein